tara:strand:+ start:8913 stop:9299 length:387 start_codon:yes stop_codon:yes gene_type:complete
MSKGARATITFMSESAPILAQIPGLALHQYLSMEQPNQEQFKNGEILEPSLQDMADKIETALKSQAGYSDDDFYRFEGNAVYYDVSKMDDELIGTFIDNSNDEQAFAAEYSLALGLKDDKKVLILQQL